MTVGKFEACANSELGEKLYEMTMTGCDQELGEVDNFGWYGLLLDIDGKSYIVNEDNNGFFTYTEYDNSVSAQLAFSRLENDYEDFMSENGEN